MRAERQILRIEHAAIGGLIRYPGSQVLGSNAARPGYSLSTRRTDSPLRFFHHSAIVIGSKGSDPRRLIDRPRRP
jgi:hypothetical protein